MLPQTNLQLYRTLQSQGYAASAVTQVGAAYDLSRQLFAGCYRPSHKTFDAHLNGAAGALALWRQPLPVVIAGLLHSAYLYGNFGDGQRGATAPRRRVVRQIVGVEAEQLIVEYTSQRWPAALEPLRREFESGELSKDLVAIKLADLCDESVDGGHRYAPTKPLAFGLSDGRTSRPAFLEFVERVAGPAARDLFAIVLTASDDVAPPAELVNADRSFHAVAPGVEGLRRSRVRQRLGRIANRLSSKRVA